MSKNYSITLNGVQVDTRSEKKAAIARADAFPAEPGDQVAVLTPAGNEVYTFAVQAPKTRAANYTRVDEGAAIVDDAVIPAGYEVCYLRKRSFTAVTRVRGNAGYKIVDTRTGDVVAEASVLAEVPDVLKVRADQAKAEREAAREAEKAAKAAAKAAKAAVAKPAEEPAEQADEEIVEVVAA